MGTHLGHFSPLASSFSWDLAKRQAGSDMAGISQVVSKQEGTWAGDDREGDLTSDWASSFCGTSQRGWSGGDMGGIPLPVIGWLASRRAPGHGDNGKGDLTLDLVSSTSASFSWASSFS